MTYDALTPCMMYHTYPQERAPRTVVVQYCSRPGSVSAKVAMTCDVYMQTIDISFDPSHPDEL